jgi:hypothetical protein
MTTNIRLNGFNSKLVSNANFIIRYEGLDQINYSIWRHQLEQSIIVQLILLFFFSDMIGLTWPDSNKLINYLLMIFFKKIPQIHLNKHHEGLTGDYRKFTFFVKKYGQRKGLFSVKSENNFLIKWTPIKLFSADFSN